MQQLSHNFTPLSQRLALRYQTEPPSAIIDQNSAQIWWTFLVRGIMSLLAGVVLYFFAQTPIGLIWMLLVVLMGVESISSLGGGIGLRSVGSTIVGMISLLLLALTVFSPAQYSLVMIFYIAFWFMSLGVVVLIQSISEEMKSYDAFFSGVLAGGYILFAFYLCLNPLKGLEAVLWELGIFFLIAGVANLLVAIAVKYDDWIPGLSRRSKNKNT